METLSSTIPLSNVGSIAFSLLVALPLVLFATLISIDIPLISAAGYELQATADRLTLEGIKTLPDTYRTKNELEKQISGLGLTGELQLTSHSIKATLHQKLDTPFAALLGLSSTATISRTSEAGLAPVQITILFPDGPSLRPGLSRTGIAESPWGNTLDWPPSIALSQPPLSQLTGGRTPFLSNLSANNKARWLTQGCFNPVYSALKLSAITVVQQISALGHSNIALSFFPGSPTGDTHSPDLELYTGADDYLEQSISPDSEFCDYLLRGSHNWPDRYLSQITRQKRQYCAPPTHNSLNLQSDGCENSPYSPIVDLIYGRLANLASPQNHQPAALGVTIAQAAAAHLWHQSAVSNGLTETLYTTPQNFLLIYTDYISDSDTSLTPTLLQQLLENKLELLVIAFAHSGLSPEAKDKLESNAQILSYTLHGGYGSVFFFATEEQLPQSSHVILRQIRRDALMQ